MARIRFIPVVRQLAVLMIVVWVSSAFPAEPVTIVFKSGRRVAAQLDPRTDEQRLWMVLGNERIRVTRGVRWNEVASVLQGEEVLTEEAVRRMAQAATPQKLVDDRFITGPSPMDVPADTSASTRGSAGQGVAEPRSVRVRSVRFDAVLANWDADVEMDGLLLRPQALSSIGEPMAAGGTLHVELWSMRYVGQYSAPRSASGAFQLVGRWTAQIEWDDRNERGAWVQLPFQASHPEIDLDWAHFGLIHIEFVVPGHGVFHHTEDGFRIRPYSPLRDALERATGDRFFPGENRGRT